MSISKKTILILTIILLILLGFSSFQGAFNPKTFEKDSLSFGTQGIGQDFVNLFVVAPLLLISLFLFRKNHKTGSFLLGGTLFYVLYSYMIYAFGVNFNHLFLVYCAILGISLYTFILFVVDFSKNDVPAWFDNKINFKPMSIYMILIAALFYMLWLKDVIPALLNDSVPATIVDNNLLVNPVHVLDLAIALPACFISAILLLKNHKLGFVFAPIILLFVVILTVALIGMVVALKIRGVSEDISLIYIFSILSIIGIGFLYNFYRKLN